MRLLIGFHLIFWVYFSFSFHHPASPSLTQSHVEDSLAGPWRLVAVLCPELSGFPGTVMMSIDK